MLHVSELTEKRGAVVKDLVNIGDVMNVKIIGIDTDKKKISLSVLAIQKDEEEQEVRNYLDKQEQAEAADDAVEGEYFSTKGDSRHARLSFFILRKDNRKLVCINR